MIDYRNIRKMNVLENVDIKKRDDEMPMTKQRKERLRENASGIIASLRYEFILNEGNMRVIE